MTDEKKYVYEKPVKPELENVKEIKFDTSDFSEPDKAQALLLHLKSEGVAVTELKECDYGNYYTVNPRYVLEGHSPQDYKDQVEALKKILTKEEIKLLNRAIGRKTKVKDDKYYTLSKYTDKLYHQIEKRTDKLYSVKYKTEMANSAYRIYPKKTTEEIKNAIEFLSSKSSCGINNMIYHLLSKKDDLYIVCYHCAWKGLPVPDEREWKERDDGEYRVLTDSEADQAFEDQDWEEYWKMAVEAGNTTSSMDDWVEQVKDNDGRGNQLSSYDCQEHEQDVDGTTYYIYRTN